MLRRLVRLLVALFGIVALLAIGALAAGWWFAGSETGLQWALGRIEKESGGRLKFESARGTLLGPVEIGRIVYADGEQRVQATGARIEWNWRALPGRSLELHSLKAAELEITPKPASQEPLSPPDSLALPLAVEVRRFEIDRVVLAREPDPLVLGQIAGRYEGGPSRHRIALESAQSAWGVTSGEVRLGARFPFELAGTVRLAAEISGLPLAVEAKLHENLLAPRVLAGATFGEVQAEGEARLKPFERAWLGEALIEARGIDLAAFVADAPRSDAQLTLRATGGAEGRLQGRIELANAAAGPLSGGRLPLASLESAYAIDGRKVRLEGLRASFGAGGAAQGSGEIDGARATLALKVEALDLHAFHASVHRTRLRGTLQLEAAEASQKVALDLADAKIRLAAKVRREGGRVALDAMRAVLYGGELGGTGSLDLSGQRPFAASLKARGFDPARFGEFPRAVLNGTVEARGTLEPRWRAQVQATLAGSRLRGAPLDAQAKFDAAPGLLRSLAAEVRVGDNRAKASGGFGAPGEVLEVAFDARNLAQIDPRAAGRIAGKARIEGTTKRIGGTFEAEGANLAFEGAGRIARLQASGTIPSDPRQRFALDARAGGVDLPQAQLQSAQARVSGTLEAHDIVAQAKGGTLDAHLAASGGWNERSGWRGKVTRFANAGDYRIELAGETMLQVSPGRVSVGAATLRALGGDVALQSFLWDHGRIASAGRIRSFPATPLAALAGWQPQRGSDLALNGEWSLEARPRLSGHARLERVSGDLILAGEPPLALGLEALALEARAADDVIALKAALRSGRIGQADLQARIAPGAGAQPGVVSKTARLSGTLGADVQSLGFLQQWTGSVAAFDGKARAKLQLAGSLGAPAVTGTLALDAVRIDMPQHGLALREGSARIALDERRIVVESLSMRGGEGTLHASGAITRDDRDATFEWRAEKLRLLNRPDRELVATGSGKGSLTGKQLVLRGELKADQGTFLVGDADNERLGDDVIVEGRTQSAAPPGASKARPLDFDMVFDAGERLRVRASGLDAELRGRLRVRSRADGDLSAHGAVEMRSGTYQAFGQKLVIERGRLTFDGPVRNPGLDVLALRKNQQVEAGVEVRGTLRTPVTRLVSEPPVPDQEKLSWLLLGRGSATAQGAEAALLQAALASLAGSRGGAPIGQGVARRLGLDEVGLRSGLTGGQVLAFGKRIANRIYVEYEQGLTVAAQLVRLKLELTKTLNARIEAGAQGGRIGFGYDHSFN